MTSRDFAYWLQGFFELSNTNNVSPDQVKMIKNHLNLVFKHDIDPSFDLTPEQNKEAKNIHDGVKSWNTEENPLVRC